MKLNIGSGEQKIEGMTNVDLYVESADIKAPMWEIPLEDGSVEAIYSSHALEHVPMQKVLATLKEWFRLLQPGGQLVLEVPNLDYVCRYWLTGPDRQWAEMMVFGNQAHEGEFHKCGWQPMTLQNDLQAAGFTVQRIAIQWDHGQETIRGEAVKPKE